MKKPTSKTLLLITFLLLTIYFTDTPIQAQNETEPISTHYVFPDFVIGSVKMKYGLTEEAVMDYNMLTEEMIFEKNGGRLAMDKLDKIDTVYIESRKFIPHDKVFYEVLVNDRVALFIQHKCNLLPAGSPAGYGGTSETSATTSLSMLINSGSMYKLKLPSEYHVTDASQFWIRRDNTFYKANSNSQILKIFPEKSKEIKQFIKQNNLNIKNTEDLITLVNKCNELIR
jgi:hypothetical protein